MRNLKKKLYAIYDGNSNLHRNPNHGPKVYSNEVTARRALGSIKTQALARYRSTKDKNRIKTQLEFLHIREFKATSL